MAGNIVVGVIVVAIIVLGIWVWWLENGPETRDKDGPKTEK